MSIICETCDTKNRLGMCSGKCGNFNYCFRKVGSVCDLEETITPFNTIEDLYSNPCHYIQSLDKDSLTLDSDFYGKDCHIKLMRGKFLHDYSQKLHPVGFVIC